MKKEKLELRMYGLVPYNLSPIQQGIQFGHAVVEYGLKYFKDASYQEWAQNHKTFVVLNGGTTNGGLHNPGTMQRHLDALKLNKVKVATFYEPDLNDALTAVVFIVDERVFNREKYPDETFPFPKIGLNFPRKTIRKYFEWEKSPQGIQVKFMREFLKQFKLA